MSRRIFLLGSTSPSFSNTLSTYFNGVNQYAFNNGAHQFGTATSFAIGFWIKIPASGFGQRIISCMDAAFTTGYDISIQAGEVIRFEVVRLRSAGNFLRIESGSLTPGQWYSVLVSYQGGADRPGSRDGTLDMRMYIDGVSVGAGTGTIGIGFSNTSVFTVASFNNGQGAFFDSNLDEISVYSGYKDATLASAIYGAGTPTDRGGDADILSWWRMGDGDTYPTLTDNIGSDNLTMVNMSTANFVNDVP